MGGYGSGRWGRRLTKGTTDEALRLDVRWLARKGLIVPGAAGSLVVACCQGGEPAGSVAVGYDGGRPGAVVLDYGVRRGEGAPWEPVRELVALARTPCRFGGERPWFRCPGCLGRRAVLFGAGGRFRCRACHGLAYDSTRESARERDRRRADALRRRIGSEPGALDAPGKPKGMHPRTFGRIVAEINARERAAHAASTAEAAALLTRLDGRSGSPTGG